MKDSASIQVRSDRAGVLFAWLKFDGDDCFDDFHIDITSGAETERFDFGPCVIRGLRRSVRFFRGQLDEAGGGFGFPDIRTYDLTRTENGFMLEIRFQGSGSFRGFEISEPTLIFDDELLKQYDDSDS